MNLNRDNLQAFYEVYKHGAPTYSFLWTLSAPGGRAVGVGDGMGGTWIFNCNENGVCYNSNTFSNRKSLTIISPTEFVMSNTTFKLVNGAGAAPP